MNRRGSLNRRIWAMVAAAGAMLVSSCASITVDALPQPGGGYRGGHELVMEFANVLNLPERAKVVMDGTTVGVVTGVTLMSDYVEVISRIDSGVSVPPNIHATLEQATVLGDIYVALESPRSDEPAAAQAGSPTRIPLARTTSPPQLEDTIANLANFVGSGSIQRAQDTIMKINRVTPSDKGELRGMVSRVAANLSDLGNNMDMVDQWLAGVSGTANVMYDKRSSFGFWFSPKGMQGWDRITQVATYTGTLLPSIGSVYSGGFWLVPLMDSLGTAVGDIQRSKWAFEGEEVAAWRRLFTDSFLPVDKHPAINITSIVGPDGREMIGNVQDVLRIMGATP